MKQTLSRQITRFFTSYLRAERGVSENTIAAYSDSLRLFIKHLCDLHLDKAATITLTGKGRKTRAVPLWSETVDLIEGYLKQREHAGIQSEHLFLNNKNKTLTRFGIGRRVELHANNAAKKYPSLKEIKLTPHVFRHTTALHLIETGSDITVVKEWLGHADIKTTSQYIDVSVKRKQKALEKLPPPGSGERVIVPEWKTLGILEFLSRQSGRRNYVANSDRKSGNHSKSTPLAT